MRARWRVGAAARPARHASAAPSTLSPVETAGYYTHAHSRVARPAAKKLCNIHAAAAPASETACTLRQPPLLRRALTYLRITFDAPVARPDVRRNETQALAKLQSTRASLTDYAVELDKSADAKTGYKAKYADGKDYVLATYEKTKTQVNEYAVEPTTTYATETYAYVGDKFVSTKDYAADTYDSAKTYTYDTTLSLVENAKAMTEKMMLAMGSRKEAPETVAAEAEVMEA